MKAISYICFTLGLISIISGTTLAIHAIWVGANATLLESSYNLWRSIPGVPSYGGYQPTVNPAGE